MFVDRDSGTGHQETTEMETRVDGRFQCLGREGRQSGEEKLNGAGVAEKYQEIKLICS